MARKKLTPNQATILRDLVDNQGSHHQAVAWRIHASISSARVGSVRGCLKRIEGRYVEQDRRGHWFVTQKGRDMLWAYDMDTLIAEMA